MTFRSGARLDTNRFVLDRIIHEPGRLMIVATLAFVKECDFL